MADPMRDEDSVAERAANGEGQEETQEELFPQGQVIGDGVSLKSLVKAQHKVTTSAALSKAKIPLRGGLPDPNARLRLMVVGVPAKLHNLPIREDASDPLKVTGWELTQDVRVDHVENVPPTERELVLNRFRAFVDESPQAAGKLLEELQQMLAEELQAA